MYKVSAEELKEKMDSRLEIVDQVEWESWRSHPCTQALTLMLQADEAGAFEDWINDEVDEDWAKIVIKYTERMQLLINRDGLYNKEQESLEYDS